MRRDSWANNLWDLWRREKECVGSSLIPSLKEISKYEINVFVLTFIMDLRKENGNLYPPGTIHNIICGIQANLRSILTSSINLLKDAEFDKVKKTVNCQMMKASKSGANVLKKQAEPITREQEDDLCQKGIIGDETPLQLIRAIFYLNGKNFALRGDEEHRNLKLSQITVKSDKLEYHEITSKTWQGGISSLKIKPKFVIHHDNSVNPKRCHRNLMLKYLNSRPVMDSDIFYLTPRKSLTSSNDGNVWFLKEPMGKNMLSSMMKKIVEAAGWIGYYTNHSLRATVATTLYQEGVDEQLIMERTGHRSIQAVRSYKRTSEKQLSEVSRIIDGNSLTISGSSNAINITNCQVTIINNYDCNNQ